MNKQAVDENYVINFGKNKGLKLCELETDYLKWLVKSDFLQKGDGKYKATNDAIVQVCAKIVHERAYGDRSQSVQAHPLEEDHPSPRMNINPTQLILGELSSIQKKLDHLVQIIEPKNKYGIGKSDLKPDEHFDPASDDLPPF